MCVRDLIKQLEDMNPEALIITETAWSFNIQSVRATPGVLLEWRGERKTKPFSMGRWFFEMNEDDQREMQKLKREYPGSKGRPAVLIHA